MTDTWAWGSELLRAFGQLVRNPFYYIGLLVVVLQYRQQIKLERKLFHTRLHSLLGETWRVWLGGLAGGAAASVLLLATGVSLPPETILFVWGAAILLMLVRVRYVCIAYAAGVLGVLKTLGIVLPGLQDASATSWLFGPLASMDMASLLMLVGVLHLVEGWLVRWQGARLATPVFLESKRGKLVGGYMMQGAWPVPLFLLVPTGDSPLSLMWTPFLTGPAGGHGWSLLAFPAMLGFSAYTLSRMPRAKAAANAKLLYGYGIILIGAALLTHVWPPFLIAACLLAIGLHEGMILYSAWQEEQAQPYFVHDTRGLFIQAVLPNSPAAELGLQTGEIIHKVNQMKVSSKEDLHHAMQLNPAYCKLEVLNHEGHSKFVGRALYAGEHHQLGILLAPDDQAPYFVTNRPVSFLAYLKRRLGGLAENRQAAS